MIALSPEEWDAVRLSLLVAGRSVLFGLPVAVGVGWALLVLFGVRRPVGAWLNDWFGVRLVFTTGGSALATAVMSFPLMVRAMRLSLEAVDPGMEAAARTLGAGPVDRFLTVTLPLAIYAATQVPGGEATAGKLAAVSLTLALAGLLLSELIARRMHRLLG